MADGRLELITPDWPAPEGVHACSTGRAGGVSRGPFASLNLGDHVGDDPQAVASNRALLQQELGVSVTVWLEQVHGTDIIAVDRSSVGGAADGAITDRPGVACAIMTADCLPLLLTDRAGMLVAAVHCGWRGLAAGIVERAVAAFVERGFPPEDLLAWLGPAIGSDAYEVGPEVGAALGELDVGALAAGRPGHWQLDLAGLARARLADCGVERVFASGLCTLAEPERFFSYRRDGSCGRQATLIWIDR